ncbi:MAG TPA: hypothetical protein VK213_12910 [Bacteroidales bacterium]|nr:hypothetical protein [Bacteroidales bacterium]
MKNILFSLLIGTFVLFSSFIQDQFRFNPTGSWLFNAGPDARPFDKGKVEISVTEGKHNINISIPDTDISVAAENIRLTGDSLKFFINLVEASANVLLRIESNQHMSGTVVTSSDDEIPVELVREE